MAWSIPTLTDLVERSRTAFQTYLPGSDATVWPSNVTVSAKVIAGRIYELFHRQEYLAQQAFPLTATGSYLERHAQSYGISRRTDIQSSGTIFLTSGTHTTLIPSGTQFQTAAGNIYSTTAAAYIDSDGAATIPIRADLPGYDYNLSAGENLTMLAVIAGAPTTGTVGSAGVYGGSAIESDDSLRERLLTRLRFPPHAGTKTDYQRWALEIPGVTRVWVESNWSGPGTVGVWFAMDDVYEDGIPQPADVAILQSHLESLAPVTARVTAAAPVPEPLAIEVTGLSPYNANVIESVKSELRQVIRDKAEVSTVTETEYFRASWVWQAVSNATGERYHTVKIPAEDFPIPVGRMPVYDEAFIRLGA